MSIKEWTKQVFIPYGEDLFLMSGMGGIMTVLGVPYLGGAFAGVVYLVSATTKALLYNPNNPPNFGYRQPQFGKWKRKAKDVRAEGKELLIPDVLFDAFAESAAVLSKRSDRILEGIYRKIRSKSR
ncbi:Uncharacterised protein [uncultured archaeon]|nr:Uncharacterised protein [uncultured archaeon]